MCEISGAVMYGSDWKQVFLEDKCDYLIEYGLDFEPYEEVTEQCKVIPKGRQAIVKKLSINVVYDIAPTDDKEYGALSYRTQELDLELHHLQREIIANAIFDEYAYHLGGAIWDIEYMQGHIEKAVPKWRDVREEIY